MIRAQRVLRVLWLSLLLPLAAATPPANLRQTAEKTGLLMGAAVRPSLFPETAYSATLNPEFNMVEPEDAMKW